MCNINFKSETLDDYDSNLDIVALKLLEQDMYLQGDNRHSVIRSVLDLMHEHGIIKDVYEIPRTEYA